VGPCIRFPRSVDSRISKGMLPKAMCHTLVARQSQQLYLINAAFVVSTLMINRNRLVLKGLTNLRLNFVSRGMERDFSISL
jgi:hypothetical protein